jgi:hypothetical protein
MSVVLWSMFAAAFLFVTAPAFAEITVLKCNFTNATGVYFIIYDDEASVLVGPGPRVGVKGLLFRHPRNDTIVVVEQDMDGVPRTFTTITAGLDAVHSRVWINRDGSVSAPSQGLGRCQRERST